MTTTHCSHQWIIKTRGPVSIDTCRLCGLEKEFSNSGEDRVNRALLSPVNPATRHHIGTRLVPVRGSRPGV